MESSTENIEQINETGQRKNGDRRQNTAAVTNERRKVQRRRLIDPTTCERDYTNDEIEFMQAMDEYKRKSGRMFPTCSEILEVIRGMGYVRLENPQLQEDNENQTEELTGNSGSVRTSEIISEGFDQLDDLEEEFDDEELDHDFDDE